MKLSIQNKQKGYLNYLNENPCSIFADLYCPTKMEISRNTEVQIKWQYPEVRGINSYRVGDSLEKIEEECTSKAEKTNNSGHKIHCNKN